MEKTIDLIQYLKTQYSHTFYWVIGEDNAQTLFTWHRYTKLIKAISFLVFPRKIKNTTDLIPSSHWNKNWYFKKPHLYLNQFKNVPISSSQIQTYLKKHICQRP